MNVIWIKDTDFPVINDDICCAIGNFDGVHLGHQQLINSTKVEGYKSAVLTFYPHPFTFLKEIKPYRQITPINHKLAIIEQLGVDYVFVVHFDERIATMPKELFLDKLENLGIKKIVCGYDFTFGAFASGNVSDLKKRFVVNEIPKYQIDNVRVSSTYIKELIQNGNVSRAGEMLGRSYSIRGKVVTGKHVGRNLGFPTANLAYDIYYIPKNGVYASRIIVKGKSYICMTNVGVNPTIDFSEEIKIETHIFDFEGDIYGEDIEVFFDERIRSEHKFNSKDELANQLKKDKIEIRRFYEKRENNEITSCNSK